MSEPQWNTQRVAKAELNIAQWLSSRNSNYSEDYLRARPAAAADCAEGVYCKTANATGGLGQRSWVRISRSGGDRTAPTAAAQAFSQRDVFPRRSTPEPVKTILPENLRSPGIDPRQLETAPIAPRRRLASSPQPHLSSRPSQHGRISLALRSKFGWN